MKNFLSSHRLIIVLAVIFSVCLVIFNVFDITKDSTDKRDYTAKEIETIDIKLVDINKAGIEELCTLPEISDITVQKIIEYREENGGFKNIEEIQNVNGIGERTFIKLRPLITV